MDMPPASCVLDQLYKSWQLWKIHPPALERIQGRRRGQRGWKALVSPEPLQDLPLLGGLLALGWWEGTGLSSHEGEGDGSSHREGEQSFLQLALKTSLCHPSPPVPTSGSSAVTLHSYFSQGLIHSWIKTPPSQLWSLVLW